MAVKDIPIEELYSHPVVQELLDKAKTTNIDLESIKIPYVIKDKVLMSPGVWNNFYYSPTAIKDAFLNSSWDDKEIRSLFLDHLDRSSKEWIGEVVNPRLQGEHVVGDLVIVDKPTAQKLAFGAKMGISPKVHGQEDNSKMLSFLFDNFSVVINPAVKTAYINNMEVNTMAKKKMEEEEQPAEDTPVEETPVPPKEEVTEEAPEAEAEMSIKDLAAELEKTKAEMAEIKKKMAEEEPEPVAEEEPVEAEPEMSQVDILNQIVKLAAMLKPGEKAPEEDPKKKVPPPPPPAPKEKIPDEQMAEKDKQIQTMQDTIKELSDNLTKVEKKLNEPVKASVKTQELAQSQEAMIANDPDGAFLNILQRMRG